jgi:hypothetical protein
MSEPLARRSAYEWRNDMVALVLAVIGAVAAAIATGASLWQGRLIRRQLEVDDQIRRASFYQQVTGLYIQLDMLLFEHPEMEKYLRENVEIPDGPEGVRVRALGGFVVDMAESLMAAETALPELEGDWDDSLHLMYENSPAVREHWRRYGYLYPPTVKVALLGPSRRLKGTPPFPLGREQREQSQKARDASP